MKISMFEHETLEDGDIAEVFYEYEASEVPEKGDAVSVFRGDECTTYAVMGRTFLVRRGGLESVNMAVQTISVQTLYD